MTLEQLENIERQLQAQNAALPSTADPSKPTLLFCNQIELSAAMSLMKQLITQEKFNLAAPPGATGPAGI